ncbi:MAG TPA: hypothetical protein VFY48_09060 [Solirubrobacterales bacterium]|nr:hypothetical protein [Solirubrobacterales bacterium]
MQSLSLKNIRTWRGSQDQAFEELCFQLRDPCPPGAELIKTGSPDGGVEWYVKHRNGVEWGWQAKYSFDIDSLLGLMEESLKTVIKRRPACRRLIFCIPFDLSDRLDPGKRKSARQKFEDRKRSWRTRLEGADRIRIELWQEGDLLDRLNGHPNQRGISWFFWRQEVFSPEWCAQRLQKTIDAAGERYTPELHLELPIAFELEGLAASEEFWGRYSSYCRRIEKLGRRVSPSRWQGLGRTPELRNLRRSIQRWEQTSGSLPVPPERLNRAALSVSTREVTQATVAAFPQKGSPEEDQRAKEQKGSLRYQLGLLEDALLEFERFLDSPAAQAAEQGALLVTGDAGQGKTHLFCDAGSRAIKGGRPAAVFLGGQLSGRDVLAALAGRLGLSDIGAEALVGAMQAAGEASGAPFLVLIDALNESAEPEGWQEELPALLAELRGNPWVAVAFSVRSSFLPAVLPAGGLPDTAAIEHPGFRGKELEATERFFDHFGLAQPRVPLLTPEFSNPLFLKLYCEGLKGAGLQVPPDGEAHISEVFGRYLTWKEERIVKHLKLDPALKPVAEAVERFSREMVVAGREQVPYLVASEMMAEVAPSKTDWPHTLFGQLLSEGILTAEMAWDMEADDYRQVVRFTYQRFADHQAVRVMLDSFASVKDLEAAVGPRKALRRQLYAAPVGWIEALSIQVPERFGVELYDLTEWRHPARRMRSWDRALVSSIAARDPMAITQRTRDLLQRAQKRSHDLREQVLDALLAVAPHPSHPLNAQYLHSRLFALSLPHRDVAWSMPTYFVLGRGGPLERLLRWAARGPHTQVPDDVVYLAAMTTAWVFTSPNRQVRDYATKALVQLLAGRLHIVAELLQAFRGANDPYVVERIAVVAHGCILCGGPSAPESAREIALVARQFIQEEKTPSLITRDAVRGIFEWCFRQGLIEEEDYAAVKPPYGSAPPSKPRTKKQLERAYGRNRKDRQGNYIPSKYSSLFYSLFDLGDFGRYVVGTKVDDFSQYPLNRPIPKPRIRRNKALEQRRWRGLDELLSDDQKAALADADSAFDLLDELEPEQFHALRAALDPQPPPDPKIKFSPDWANRWIFERVLELGWDPELFDSWERTYVRGFGREGHKPERFGKKYQWIALRELLARIADNFHMADAYREKRPTYEGPWQFFGRDIDPTLPPASLSTGPYEEAKFGDTFPPDSLDSWWVPPGPTFLADDPPVPDDWASDTSDIPSTRSLVERIDGEGERWITFHAYFNWDEETDDEGDIRSPRRRDLWSHIKSWLVPREHERALAEFLRTRSLMDRWMPEGMQLTDAAYLAEMPWATSTREYPDDWRQVEPRLEDPPVGLLVYPAWADYHWEGVVWDCSIDESVFARVPAPELFDVGHLSWKPTTREWLDPAGQLVAQFRESHGERHSALVVKEQWLAAQLEAGGWSLVVGRLGEKQLFTSGFHSDLIASWTVINGVASFDGKRWRFRDPVYEERLPAREMG